MSKRLVKALLSVWLCLGLYIRTQAQDELPEQPTTVAVLGVYEKGPDVKDLGGKLDTLIIASLTTRDNLLLVERAELDKVMAELELNLSGMVDPKTANQIGHMVGANVLVSAATFQLNGMIYVVAKVIGTETTRVFGVSVKGDMNELDELVEKLVDGIDKTIVEKRAVLTAQKKPTPDRLAALKAKVGKAKLPVVAVDIGERHVGRSVADPAAQTELIHALQFLGFTIIDGKQKSAKQADLFITGDAVSEFAMQRQTLIGVRARVELSIKDQSGKVWVADRQSVSKVALTEQIAGKVAIEEAAMDLAERVIPKLVEQWNR